MFCKYCGYDIVEGNVCPNCGKENEEEVIEVISESSPVNEETAQGNKKIWDVFAKMSYVSGIVTFIVSFLTFGLTIFFSVASLVFSCLGKKSFAYNDKAKTGFKFSLASTIISGVLLTILVIACIVIGVLAICGISVFALIMAWIII